MKAVGLDTSIVVRLLVGVPEAQAKVAMDYLERVSSERKKVFVCDLVVAEAYFALTYHYDVPKNEAMAKLLDFLESGVVSADPGGVAVDSLKSRESSKAGFVDRLIRNHYLQFTEEVATFDAVFGKLSKVRSLKE